jgi:hypothetical protein
MYRMPTKFLPQPSSREGPKSSGQTNPHSSAIGRLETSHPARKDTRPTEAMPHAVDPSLAPSLNKGIFAPSTDHP